jgi:hypothetical protein
VQIFGNKTKIWKEERGNNISMAIFFTSILPTSSRLRRRINNQRVGYKKLVVGSQNFEYQITYMVRQKATINEMMVYQRVESIHIYVPKIMLLPRVKPTITKVVLVAFRMRCNEPKLIRFIQGAVGKGEKVWTKGVHMVKKIPKPNLVWCT